MQRYLGKMRGVTTAADRLIAYYEKTPNPENAKADRLARQFEKAALAARQADLNLMRELDQQYGYDGVDSCAADGMCQTACPVSINTGELVKRLREEARVL